MGRQKSPERLRLEEILSDGNWIDREDLFAKWSEDINPAKARRAAAKSYGGSGGRVKQVSDQQLEIYGARHIFNQTLGAMRSINRIEERKTRDGVEIRYLSEKITADLDSYTSLVILDETHTETLLDAHDPRNSTLIISLRRLQEWPDDRLDRLISWCNVRIDESSAYALTRLMALKVLNNRKEEFQHRQTKSSP